MKFEQAKISLLKFLENRELKVTISESFIRRQIESHLLPVLLFAQQGWTASIISIKIVLHITVILSYGTAFLTWINWWRWTWATWQNLVQICSIIIFKFTSHLSYKFKPGNQSISEISGQKIFRLKENLRINFKLIEISTKRTHFKMYNCMSRWKGIMLLSSLLLWLLYRWQRNKCRFKNIGPIGFCRIFPGRSCAQFLKYRRRPGWKNFCWFKMNS